MLFGLVVFGALGACTGIKPYPNSYDKNVRINVKTDSSLFSKLRTAVDIYRVDNTCQKTYEGTLQLRDATMLVGLSNEHPVYLVFVFQESSFLANSHSSITYETVFRPESDNHYEFEVSYVDKCIFLPTVNAEFWLA
jgi:hypothetical protein